MWPFSNKTKKQNGEKTPIFLATKNFDKAKSAKIVIKSRSRISISNASPGKLDQNMSFTYMKCGGKAECLHAETLFLRFLILDLKVPHSSAIC